MSLAVSLRRPLEAFTLEAQFTAPRRGVTALYGPSGAGKTTVLRALAGLDRETAGSIRLGDTTWLDDDTFLAPHERGVGYVFQEPSLFEHLDVAGNIAYGLRRRAGNHGARRDELVDLLDLGALLHRRPQTLSGGEQRRVAIARALAPEPALLLMDEPLAGLDAARRADVLPYIETLAHRLEIPVLLVSHQFDEVARLADHLVLLEDGRVLAEGAIDELVTDPELPLASGFDAAAVLTGSVSDVDTRWSLVRVRTGNTEFVLPAEDLAPGETVRLRIAARDVSVAMAPPAASSILNVLPATVLGMRARGPLVTVHLELEDGGRLLARITARSARDLALDRGTAVFAQVKGVAVLR